MRKLFAELSKAEIANNPNSYVLLGDIGVGAFLNKEDQLPDRVFNMGIAEQAMIGFGSGLSISGGNVIVHTIAAFLVERAFEQIKLCCSYNNAKLILISANGPYEYEKLGPTHHCPNDVSILSTLPNFNIRVPATLQEFRDCYAEALTSLSSTYIRATNRVATVDNFEVLDSKWKMVYGTSPNAVVCIGESLTYQLTKDSNDTIYWTTDPSAILPYEASLHNRITILEPYTQSQIRVPRAIEHKVWRKCFSREHKKTITKNMGWEDFE